MKKYARYSYWNVTDEDIEKMVKEANEYSLECLDGEIEKYIKILIKV